MVEPARKVPGPTLQSFILADEVYMDGATGKKVICGTFNMLRAKQFPAQFGRSTKAYLCLTGCRGRCEIVLRYVDLKDGSVMIELPAVIESPDPLRPQEVVMEIPPLPMPHAGAFAFEAHCNHQQLGVIRVQVQQQEGQEAPR